MFRDDYVESVMKYIDFGRRIRKNIRQNLIELVSTEEQLLTYDEMVDKFGSPEEMASHLIEKCESSEKNYGITTGLSRQAKPYEYKSEIKIFGQPLIHINIGGRYRLKVAKGIIAIGDVSIGLVSIGGVSMGLVSFGGIAIGALIFGGIALGGLAVGGIAIGYFALGGIAYGISWALGGITKVIFGGLL